MKSSTSDPSLNPDNFLLSGEGQVEIELSMKIKGMDWMDWVHHIREEALEQHTNDRRTLSQYLKTIEKEEAPSEEQARAGLRKKGKR